MDKTIERKTVVGLTDREKQFKTDFLTLCDKYEIDAENMNNNFLTELWLLAGFWVINERNKK